MACVDFWKVRWTQHEIIFKHNDCNQLNANKLLSVSNTVHNLTCILLQFEVSGYFYLISINSKSESHCHFVGFIGSGIGISHGLYSQRVTVQKEQGTTPRALQLFRCLRFF